MMPRITPTSRSLNWSSDKGAALIIVLAFVVLLTGLIVAYFSRTTTDRQLAQSSFNDTDADLLARSALDVVVGDFKQEIANASTVTTANILPARSGNPSFVPATGTQTPTDPIPNLIRRSVRSDAIVPGSRASAVNSATDPSVNGRSVGLARWNSHYLIPKANQAPGDDNSDPVPSFTPPDWVIVTRNGPIPFPSWNSALKDPTSTNTTYAVGRYGYAVYDEGGLLDINVAGYPTSSITTDIGRKGVLAYADLTALPTTPGNYVSSTTAVNKFILFRNYVTTNSSSTLVGATAFTSGQASTFANYYLSSTRVGTSQDFGSVRALKVQPGALSSSRTDQNFVTRAELINFRTSTGIASVNTLQYLGTFSREQNKPTVELTSAWPTTFPPVVLPQRFYIGNLNLVVPGSTNAAVKNTTGLKWAPPPPKTPDHWEYWGAQIPDTDANWVIPKFPPDLTTLDFFQYLNYALHPDTWNTSTDDSGSSQGVTHIASTLSIGATLIDQYDLNNATYTEKGFWTTQITYYQESAKVTKKIAWGMESSDIKNLPNTTPPVPIAGYYCLTRPIRNVGEFGYAYNALSNPSGAPAAGTTLNFKDPYNYLTNPDPALLDFFTYNSAPVRSGIVSLNTRQAPVLAAILKAAITKDSTSAVVGTPGSNTAAANADANNAANSIVNATTVTPALSRADIARLASTSVVTTTPFTNDDGGTYEARKTIARALAECVQTRTWGLLIDVVAQTGHYGPNAQGLADFAVDGEKRYWLHIAIDRFDGTVVGQQLEEVIE